MPPIARPARRRNLKAALLIVAGMLAGVLLVVGGIAFTVYDKATRIDRSDPDVVLEQYITSVFDRRDQERAKLFTCGSDSDLGDINRFLDTVTGLEKKYSIAVTVQVISSRDSIRDDRATVDAKLAMDVPEESGVTSRAVYDWRFPMENRGGWRICGADNLSRPS
jgi:hypothetical protein